jgi:hypothetical protein
MDIERGEASASVELITGKNQTRIGGGNLSNKTLKQNTNELRPIQ